MNRNIQLIAVVIFNLIFVSHSLQAALVLELAGVDGGSSMSYVAYGSVVVPSIVPSTQSGAALVPVEGAWNGDFDNNLGDFLSNFNNTLNDGLALSNGGVSYKINGIQFALLDTIDIDPSDATNGDDIELDPSSIVDYPKLNLGDTISWYGQGSFLLEHKTVDEIFLSGTFQNSIDGGSYIVVVNVIPEPEYYIQLYSICGLLIYLIRAS